MAPHESPSVEQVRESWHSLQRFYRSEVDAGRGAKTDYQFRYIVDRLIDSETAGRFTIGEAFALPSHGSLGSQSEGPHSPSAGRALYFTLDPFGTYLDEAPHVAMYFDVSQLMATYCRGQEVITTHICQQRKEIPCLLSLLDMLWRDRDLPRPASPRWDAITDNVEQQEKPS